MKITNVGMDLAQNVFVRPESRLSGGVAEIIDGAMP
jgi:hypothetical protein